MQTHDLLKPSDCAHALQIPQMTLMRHSRAYNCSCRRNAGGRNEREQGKRTYDTSSPEDAISSVLAMTHRCRLCMARCLAASRAVALRWT
jgi:hypothetical protein